MGPDAMILVIWMLSFKSTFSLSSFTFIERLFSSSSRSAIRVVSSAYLRLLIFLSAILTHLKIHWCWERLRAGEEGDGRGWDGWMASPTRWTWIWADSGSCCWRGRPGVLGFMGSQRVRHDWATELNWTSLNIRFLAYRKLLIFIPIIRPLWGLKKIIEYFVSYQALKKWYL